MAVGAGLRSKVAGSLPRRGPRGRGRRRGDADGAALLEQLELPDGAAEGAAGAGRPGARSARRVHLAALPERYEPLEEPGPGDKPKGRYRQKLKKYGKVGALAMAPGAGAAGRSPGSLSVPLESSSPVPALWPRSASPGSPCPS